MTPPTVVPAFSTVACPEWTLDRVALAAQRLGFGGVELRTFGVDSRRFACDPALTDAAKVRRMFAEAGVALTSIATDLAFDAPVNPPVIGHLIADQEVAVRAAQRAVDLAASLECPVVRVFGFRLPVAEEAGAARAGGVARIAERLGKVLDHAAKTGVRLAIENGGSFRSAAQVREIVDAVRSPLLTVSYNIAAACSAGERPAEGVAQLGTQLGLLRVKDLQAGRPVLLGTGELTVRESVLAAAACAKACGSAMPVVFEWDRAWLAGLPDADLALDHASRTMWQWIGATAGGTPARAAIVASAY